MDEFSTAYLSTRNSRERRDTSLSYRACDDISTCRDLSSDGNSSEGVYSMDTDHG